jgi:uncharacterized iron-regulated membrane protein
VFFDKLATQIKWRNVVWSNKEEMARRRRRRDGHRVTGCWAAATGASGQNPRVRGLGPRLTDASGQVDRTPAQCVQSPAGARPRALSFVTGRWTGHWPVATGASGHTQNFGDFAPNDSISCEGGIYTPMAGLGSLSWSFDSFPILCELSQSPSLSFLLVSFILERRRDSSALHCDHCI